MQLAFGVGCRFPATKRTSYLYIVDTIFLHIVQCLACTMKKNCEYFQKKCVFLKISAK